MSSGVIPDLYTLTSLRLNLFCNGVQISHATGFFYAFQGQTWLVSNWHVFSGRNCHTGQPSDSRGAIPDEVFFRYFYRDQETAGLKFQDCKISIRQDDTFYWMQHSKGQDVDIAAMPMGGLHLGTLHANQGVNFGSFRARSDMAFGVSSETFILGYPDIKGSGVVYAIWKRATVASEPGNDFDGSACFLVDSLVSQGMSGSPVVLRTTGPYVDTIGSFKNEIMAGLGPTKNTQLIGIFSGRYREGDALAPQLGKVWRVSEIEELISRPFAGYYDLRKKKA